MHEYSNAPYSIIQTFGLKTKRQKTGARINSAPPCGIDFAIKIIKFIPGSLRGIEAGNAQNNSNRDLLTFTKKGGGMMRCDAHAAVRTDMRHDDETLCYREQEALLPTVLFPPLRSPPKKEPTSECLSVICVLREFEGKGWRIFLQKNRDRAIFCSSAFFLASFGGGVSRQCPNFGCWLLVLIFGAPPRP